MTIAIDSSAWRTATVRPIAIAPLSRLAGSAASRTLLICRSPADPALAAFLAADVPGTKLVAVPQGGAAAAVGSLAGRHFLGAFGTEAMAEACHAAGVVVASALDDIVTALLCGAPVASLPEGCALSVLGRNGRGPGDDLPMTIGAVDSDLAVAIGRALRCDRLGVAVHGSRLACNRRMATDDSGFLPAAA